MDARRLLLGGGGLAALVSFFGMTWVDLLLARVTGFEILQLGARFTGDQSAYLLVSVPAAGLIALYAASRSERAPAMYAAVASGGGLLLMLYIVSSLSKASMLGRSVNLIGLLGAGYWVGMVGLACVIAGAFAQSTPSAETGAQVADH